MATFKDLKNDWTALCQNSTDCWTESEHGSSKEEQTWNAVRYLFLNEERKQFESPATTRESTSLLKSVENTMEVDANNIDNRLRNK
ncbi:hypothetical protein HZH68_013624 [Vespula germanica]|uniref:Uncharacterized protein n=1 Tax=Vespula germanica TaxID=30212 RepID=A0A834MV46_VESGE|nr:hypothetical protein HZH68_013624 [Vespula germanica]